MCAVTAILYTVVHMSWIDSHSRVNRGITLGIRLHEPFVFFRRFVLLASSEQDLQHALGRFSAACEQKRMQIGTGKAEVL